MKPFALQIFPLILLAGCATLSPAPLNVQSFGALGDGKTKDTAAIQKALDAAAAAGGGQVLLPAQTADSKPATYLVGSLRLPSHVTLRFGEGAELAGSPDLDDYPILKVRWEGKWIDGHAALIYATNATDISIVGPGIITANSTLGGRQMPRRPLIFEPINCTNITLDGFATHHHSMWSIHPTYCQNFTARNLTIRSTGGNGDGIDVDSCKHVLIENCDIDTGDDSIAIKSGRGMEGYRAARPTEDVVISHCKLGDSLFACIGIGSETSGGIRGVHMDHCEFTHAKSYAIYIKSRPGRGAFIEDISGDHLDVHTAPGGFLRVNLLNSGIQDPEPVPGADGIPTAKNFSFTNVKVHCGNLVDAYAISPEKPVDGFTLRDITGDCKRAIILANITNANLANITVTNYKGLVLTITNVQGKGLDTTK